MTIRRPAFDPCHDSDYALVGATVTLYNGFGGIVDQTVTDSDGIYTFTGLPFGRYRTEIDYPECDRRQLSKNGHVSPLSNDSTARFYSSGEMCESSFGDSDIMSTNDVTHFDTVDECCANIFWYDMDGCISRSRVAFQFEFCLDVHGLGGHSKCPLDIIQAIENVMQRGLSTSSELTLVKFGDKVLTNVDGETKCVGSTLDHDIPSNQLRGLVRFPKDHLNICGVVVAKEAECKEAHCLREAFEKIVLPFRDYVYTEAFSSVRHLLSRDTLHPLRDSRSEVGVVVKSFMTKELFLPSDVASSKPRKDKAATSESSATGIGILSFPPTYTETPRFYPTYISGELCRSKISVDSWEDSYGTLRECCEVFFSFDFQACCSSLNMGGC